MANVDESKGLPAVRTVEALVLDVLHVHRASGNQVELFHLLHDLFGFLLAQPFLKRLLVVEEQNFLTVVFIIAPSSVLNGLDVRTSSSKLNVSEARDALRRGTAAAGARRRM